MKKPVIRGAAKPIDVAAHLLKLDMHTLAF